MPSLNLQDISKNPAVILHSLVALEKFAQTSKYAKLY